MFNSIIKGAINVFKMQIESNLPEFLKSAKPKIIKDNKIFRKYLEEITKIDILKF